MHPVEPPAAIETRQLRIHGLVQGVGFRHSLCQEALALGLAGWVRNRHDGSVEAVLQGTSVAVAALIEWAHEGPPAAEVIAVDVAILDEATSYAGFIQAPTA